MIFWDYEIDVDGKHSGRHHPEVNPAAHRGKCPVSRVSRTKETEVSSGYWSRRENQNQVLLEIQDDGIGCTPYKLSKIREKLSDESDEITSQEEGFGLANVNKRIKLYYGIQYGLSIESQYQEGTRVSVRIPLQEDFQSKPEE